MDANQNSTQASEQATKGKTNFLIPAVIVGLVVIAAVVFFIMQGSQQANNSQIPGGAMTAPTDVTNNTSGTIGSANDTQSNDFANGTYTANGNYTSPGGAEQLGVTVTIENDIITNAEVDTSSAQRPNTIKFQGIFRENFKPFVVGKPIDEVKLDKVAGSSLSPKGFNDALEKIKREAKV